MASLFPALFSSGAAALVYQSTWGRMLQRLFGVSDLAIATVLASFFLGMGIGAALGGKLTERIQNAARAYALMEIVIGVWALLSILLIPNLHGVYASFAGDSSFAWLTCVRLVLALFVLLPPTILMGATLPVLIAAVADSGGHWGKHATRLYATNTFGAVLGAGATGLLLVPRFGTRWSIVIAACASFAAAAIVWIGFAGGPKSERTLTQKASSVFSRRLKIACALSAMAGSAALASEVLWTRVLRMVVQGTTQAFAAMLVNYLFGIAVGSLIADRVVRGRNPLRVFAFTQTLLALLTGVAMWVGSQLPRLVVLIRGEPEMVPHEAWVVLVLSAILLLPIALVVGTSIPLAWRIAGDAPGDASINAGRVLAFNTIGGLLGSMATGFFLVPTLGVDHSIMTVMVMHGFTAIVAFGAVAQRREHLVWAVLPFTLCLGVLALRPSLNLPFLLDAWYDPTTAVIEGPTDEWAEPVLFLKEGRNTTVTILEREEDSLRLFNDGRPESGIGGGAPGFGEELALLGSFPNLYADERRRAMVVGLGAGHTTTTLLVGPWVHIDVVELEEAVVQAARQLHTKTSKAFPLDDPRTHLVVDDARAQLTIAKKGSYDAVVSQPSHPWLAGSSALYTHEFFSEVHHALSEEGVFSLWVNLFRMDIPHLQSVVRTLSSVFPFAHAYVVEDSSFIMVASKHPLKMDARFAERANSTALRPYLEPFALDDLIDIAATMELDNEGMARFGAKAPIIYDDRPSFEFDLARLPQDSGLEYGDLDRAMKAIPWVSAKTFTQWPMTDRSEILLQRSEQVRLRRDGLRRLEDSIGALPLGPGHRYLIAGAVSERRGDVSNALDAYDRSASSDGRRLAADLRFAERQYAELLQQALALNMPVSSERLYLLAGLGLTHHQGVSAYGQSKPVADALQITEDPNSEDSALRSFVGAIGRGDCPAALELLKKDESPLFEEHVALCASRCASSLGQHADALKFLDLWFRDRRALASSEANQGKEALNANNRGAAIRSFRRALMAYPAHGRSAAELARLLDEDGKKQEAKEMLKNSRHNASGLSVATKAIDDVAAELGYTL